MRREARDNDGPKPNGATSTSSAFDAPPFNCTSTSTSSPPPPPSSVLIYKSILEQELKEAGKHDKTFFWGLVSLAASAFAAACRDEVEAPKPGNVHVFADGHGMMVRDFLRSAEAAAPGVLHAASALAIGGEFAVGRGAAW